MLIAQLMGRRPQRIAAGNAETPSIKYAIANQRMSGRVVSLPLV